MNEYDSYDQVPESLRKAITNSMFPPTSSEVESMKLNRSFRILPHQQDTGGFFIAVLRKKSTVNAVDHRSDTIGNASSKRQQKAVFKEDPFVFMEKNDERWDNIANHYGIAPNFPHEQLLSRTVDSEKKRTLYFVNAAIKRFLLHNPGVKVVNAGLRMFGRVEMKFETCRFRVAQDGVRELLPYMQNRVIDVSREDLHKVMIGFEGSDNVPRSTLACDEALNSLESGSVVLRTQHEGQDHVICVWMGKKSVAAYITKEERIHLIRMLGFDTSEMESTMSSKRKDKAARDRIQAEENRRIENGMEKGNVEKENGNGIVANQKSSEVEGQIEQ